jgi:SAM-dependent methyltransferase
MVLTPDKIQQFLDYFAALHVHDKGYNLSGNVTGDSHKRASKKLFQDSLNFLDRIQLPESAAVIDVGLGYGFHSEYFVQRGFEVTGITAHLSDDLIKQAEVAHYTVRKMDMHFLEFADETFDLVWSHHSLEHSFSPLLCLREWYRVLKKDGYLAVTVPPHKNEIVSGHFSVGWNIGQLMYLLGLAGFNIKKGYFIEEGYNVRALVTRPQVNIEPQGLSWIYNLKEHLPQFIQDNLNNVPASLGTFSFSGDLKVVSNEACIQKNNEPETKSLIDYCKEMLKGFIK